MSINIAKSKVAGDCNTKCAYSFDYKDCGLTASNDGSLITYGIDPVPTVPPVLYNNSQYVPFKIFIIYPSAHKYEGSFVDSELKISHYSVDGIGSLDVYIPIIRSTDTSSASILVSQMINDVAAKAPKAGNKIAHVTGVENFSLNSIIPRAPFYSYSRYGLDNIVFGLSSAIPLSGSILDSKLKKIIKEWPPSQSDDTKTKVYYNGVGPKSTLADQGIYIDCQPTGSSGQVEVVQAKNPPIYDLDTILKDPTVFMILQLLMSCLIFIVIYFFISYGFAFMTSTEVGAKPKQPLLVKKG
jgi:hypothetical protein